MVASISGAASAWRPPSAASIIAVNGAARAPVISQITSASTIRAGAAAKSPLAATAVPRQIALIRPMVVRRLVLASSAPQGAAGMHGWAPEVIGAIGTPHTSPEAHLEVFSTRSASRSTTSTGTSDSDPVILPHYSYLLAGLIPHARVKIYPDSAHGFLFQHHAEFAADIEAFLDGAS